MLPATAPGFDDPLGLLRACHDRIQKQCATLAVIAARLPAEGLTPELRTAAQAVHRYFNTAGRHHHEDEEQDLFPLLRGDAALAGLIATLQTEHAQMEALWREIEPLLARPETIMDPAGFAQRATALNALYAPHIARENEELLPRAAALLPPAVLAAMGARMAARRGLTI